METKHCPGCDTEKEINRFHRKGQRADGTPTYRRLCKVCEPRNSSNLAEHRSEEAQIMRRKRDRARKRAWLRLAELHPEDFMHIYQEELRRSKHEDVQ